MYRHAQQMSSPCSDLDPTFLLPIPQVPCPDVDPTYPLGRDPEWRLFNTTSMDTSAADQVLDPTEAPVIEITVT